MFHHFHGGHHPIVEGSISGQDLNNLIEYLKNENEIISAKAWYGRYLNGTLKDNTLCITFDDALKCQYDIAKPILDKHGLGAFWFIYTSPLEGKTENLEVYRYFKNTVYKNSDDFYDAFYTAADIVGFGNEVNAARKSDAAADHFKEYSFYTLGDRIFRFVRDKVLGREKYYTAMEKMLEIANFNPLGLHDLLFMSPADVKKLHTQGHIIGLHSHTHPTDIGALPIEQQKEEYERNFKILHRITGEKPYTSSHPSNSYSRETIELLKNMGIKLSFRANMQFVAGNYTLPREDHINIFKQMNIVA
jgi:peptidoglycan/xylan/chitin deacetylase (PgdA/CDA1 family)